jgi:Repeat of unknown function (DUF5648)
MRFLLFVCTTALLAGPFAAAAETQQASPAQRQQDQQAEQVIQQNRQHEPHMAAALEHLRQAQEELEKATPNKGGHRESALQLTTKAQSEVEAGIEWYDTHVSPGASPVTNATPQPITIAAKVPLYRLTSAVGMDRFYTASPQEKDRAQTEGYKFEGVAGMIASTQVPGTVPLYRMVRQTGVNKVEHFYTTSTAERDNAVKAYHFRVEGIAGYVAGSQQPGTVPFERLQNPKTTEYLFTTSAEEANRAATAYQYQRQGICCYVWQH